MSHVVEFDGYILKWKLRDDNGNDWIEEHKEISLSDFEVIYGNNIYEIVWFTMRLKNEAIL